MKTIRMLLSTVVLMSLMLINCITTNANPAFPHAITAKQSNGKTITYFIYGDEYVSWAKTLDGYMIMPLENGDFVYAIQDADGNMVPSSMLASNSDNRSKKETNFLKSLKKDVFYSTSQVQTMNEKRIIRDEKNKKTALKSFTTTNPKLLVILVNYSDVSFADSNAVRFKHQIQDSNYTSYGYTGSVRDYFADQSFGTINPQFKVYGPITLPKTRSYYASNSNEKAWQMARDAVKIIDTMYDVDFSEFDNDNDGVVDLVHIIYAGIGSNSTNQKESQVWPHMYYFSGTTTLDGKTFNRYACSSELTRRIVGYSYQDGIDGIGAVCHEMGHAFGLPDMYATDYGGATTPASWDVMDAGSYNNDSKTPPYYSMIERDMLGWGNLVPLQEGEHSLYPIADSNTAYKLHLNTDEYLVFEYRNHDKWDAYIPGVGMIVWHADTSKFVDWESSNSLNNDPDDRGYYIVCAGKESKLETASTPYPGSLNVTKIDYFTLNDGNQIDGHISNIHFDTTTTDSTILFTYKEYGDVKFALGASNITTNSIEFVGSFQSNQTLTDRKLEYKKSTQSSYTSVDLSSDDIVYTLTGLKTNTQYDFRLSAKIDSTTYYGPVSKLHTACYDFAISELPFNDGFEDGLNCWTIQGSNSVSWKVAKKGIGGYVSSKKGSYMAALSFKQAYTNQSARLVSPVYDLSAYDSVTLTFYYAAYSGATNPLTVYYKASSSDNWKKLSSFSNTLSSYSVSWKNAIVALKDLSSTYQFCFVGQDNAGYGVVIDDVKLTGVKKSSLNTIDDDLSNITLTPNPTKDNTVLSLNGLKGEVSIIVSDNNGRILSENKLNANNSTAYTNNNSLSIENNNVVINTSTFEKGLYYITIINDGKTVVKKLIKQ